MEVCIKMCSMSNERRFLVFTPAVGFEELLLSVQPVQNDGTRKFRSGFRKNSVVLSISFASLNGTLGFEIYFIWYTMRCFSI